MRFLRVETPKLPEQDLKLVPTIFNLSPQLKFAGW